MKKTILLVEDELVLSDMIKVFLEYHNFSVSTAYDGKEALEKAKERPHLILLDLMLPKLYGIEVLRVIKADVETKNIPVIVLTAKADSKTIFDAMEAGSFDYLIKPFDNNQLLEAIKRAL